MNLCKLTLKNGGKVVQLLLPSSITKGNGLMNPSVFIHNGKILANIRLTNYMLYHSERGGFDHRFGPLQYIHREDDLTLTTWNYLCELNNDLSIKYYNLVDTSKLDKPPQWGFIGLEDARLFSINDELYLCGVRRDVVDGGQGRMELSKVVQKGETFTEVDRVRMPTTGNDDSYCEKNWMPILDKPYHFMKWTDPVEIVKYNDNKTTVVISKPKATNIQKDFRGGSQVINFQGGYLTLIHEVDLFNNELGQKNGRYRHRFIYFDKDLNITKYSKSFSFMESEIEFCCGMALRDDMLLISYGIQDNSAFIMEMPVTLLDKIAS